MAGLLRLVAIAASATILLSFALFAIERTSESSRVQVQRIDGAAEPAPSSGGERQRERSHGALREAIDDANDILLFPFAGVTGSRDIWVQRLVSGVLALLVFGFGLSLLANYLAAAGPRARSTGSVA